MDRLHEVHVVEGETSSKIYVVRGAPDKDSRNQKWLFVGWDLDWHVESIQTRKPRMALEKPKLDRARKLRGICIAEPEDDEYKETNNARNKFEIPMEAAMPCKIGDKKTFLEVMGNCSTVMRVTVEGVAANCNKCWTSNSKRLGTLRKSSRISVTNWIVRRVMRCLTWRPMYWCVD